MAATLISRTVWANDTGGPVRDGTPINNAALQAIYDKIDLLVNGAITFGNTGAFTNALSWGGGSAIGNSSIVALLNSTNSFTANQTISAGDLTITRSAAAGLVRADIINTSSSGSARVALGNDAGVNYGNLILYGTAHATRPSELWLGTEASYPVIIQTAGVERFRINSIGNLGVGVTPSTWSVGKAFEFNTAGCGFWNAGTTSYLTANYYYNSGDKFAGSAFAMYHGMVGGDGSYRWYTSSASGSAGNTPTMGEKLRLLSTGELNVIADIKWTNDTGWGLLGNDGVRFLAYTTAGGVVIGSGAAKTILSSNVGIGTSTPNTKLDVAGNIRRSSITNGYLELSGDLTGYGANLYPTLKTNGSAIYFDVNGTYAASLSSSGVLSPSDRRLKTNIVSLTGALEILGQLRPVTYSLLHGKDNFKTHYGFIAQEIEPIIPEIVNDDPTGMKSVAFTELIALCVQSINELETLVKEQRSRIKTLEARLG